MQKLQVYSKNINLLLINTSNMDTSLLTHNRKADHEKALGYSLPNNSLLLSASFWFYRREYALSACPSSHFHSFHVSPSPASSSKSRTAPWKCVGWSLNPWNLEPCRLRLSRTALSAIYMLFFSFWLKVKSGCDAVVARIRSLRERLEMFLN